MNFDVRAVRGTLLVLLLGDWQSFHIRGTIPFTGAPVLVDGGHVMQGQGCSERNLTSLVRHVMALPRFDVVVDFLLRAFKMRRDSRRNQLPYQ